MDIAVQPGSYVVAVSGGVDSMVLLDLLAKKTDPAIFHFPSSTFQFVVAHYDHGIRPDSAEDEKLVRAAAERYGFAFVSVQGNLGERASEELARSRRYEFLWSTAQRANAGKLITAHHKDDLLETAILNLIRGTGRKGLTALMDNKKVVRPLLAYTKQDILVYAKSHGVQWHEDSTNQDVRYLRNKIRLQLMPKLGLAGRQKLERIIEREQILGGQIDELIGSILPLEQTCVPRELIAWSDFAVSCELLASWLRYHTVPFDRKTIHRVAVGVKTLRPTSSIDVSGGARIYIRQHELVLDRKK